MIQKIRTIFVPLTVLLLLTTVVTARSEQTSPAQNTKDPAGVPFMDRTVTTSDGTFRYQVFVPAHWNAHRSYPVILFLHGSGERGDDNQAQTKNGIRLLIAQDQERFPCVVVCPQCSTDHWWTQPAMEQMALAALDQSVQEFKGDSNRVYLTGLSMGAYGTWDLAQKYPDQWAAIAPCCGGIQFPRAGARSSDASNGGPPPDPYSEVAQKVVHTATWVFHGQADPTVPVSESRQMVALLFSLNDTDLKYTEYPGVGHNSWDYAYKETGLLPWLLSHKRRK